MPFHTPHTFIIAIVLTLAPAHKHTHEHTCTMTELGLDYCHSLNKSLFLISYQNFKLTSMNLIILKLRPNKSFIIVVFFVKIRYTDLKRLVFETTCGWNRNFVRKVHVLTLNVIMLNYYLHRVTINRRFIIIIIIIIVVDFVVSFAFVLWHSELSLLC